MKLLTKDETEYLNLLRQRRLAITALREICASQPKHSEAERIALHALMAIEENHG